MNKQRELHFGEQWITPPYNTICPECGGRMIACPVAVYCEFMEYPGYKWHPEKPCNYGLMSG